MQLAPHKATTEQAVGADQILAGLKLAVLVPCFNESRTVAKVVRDFCAALPRARVYVYDNNSTDGTAELARAAGADVRFELYQGKGNVVRRMFADIDADVYLLVDGDGTYDASNAPAMVAKLLGERLDMVVASRTREAAGAYRPGHRLGNRILTRAIAAIFGTAFNDILSGYRVFSRRFVKSFPAMSTGFEIETELTVHALQLRMPTAELAAPYGSRPADSPSKLHTYRDGLRILKTIVTLFKDERPFAFFGSIFVLLALTAIVLGVPVVVEFAETGLVPRFPTAILATGLMILSVISLTSGIILDHVSKGRWEAKRLAYLGIPPLDAPGR